MESIPSIQHMQYLQLGELGHTHSTSLWGKKEDHRVVYVQFGEKILLNEQGD